MSEQIINVVNELHRKWGELYVNSQETTATIEQMKTQMEMMTTHATRVMTFAMVCACVSFVLAVTAVTLLYVRWKYGKSKI